MLSYLSADCNKNWYGAEMNSTTTTTTNNEWNNNKSQFIEDGMEWKANTTSYSHIGIRKVKKCTYNFFQIIESETFKC